MMGAGVRLIAMMTLLASAGMVRAAPPAEASAEQVNLNCDAISYRGTIDAKTMKMLEPAHDLDKVATILSKAGYVFDRGRGMLTIALPPKTRAEIDELPPGEPIVLPSKDGGVVCVLVPSSDSV
ncbi:hypothetical protein [Sphingomonas sp.]|uniref:hypothetical protein n=1 Tax=Sphingomonas sp. TaxID=28214 RepID=UPI000DB79B7B|nr:hypothetical protein [Sphingomonas sp.]PZU09672.1 MAG: hypothetical protein DI605_08400 [Sphingomonas sp.]